MQNKIGLGMGINIFDKSKKSGKQNGIYREKSKHSSKQGYSGLQRIMESV